MCQDPFNAFADNNPLLDVADAALKRLLEDKYRKIRHYNGKYLPKHINRTINSRFLPITLRRLYYLIHLNALGKEAVNFTLHDFCMNKRFASTDIKPYYDIMPTSKLPLKFVEWFCEKPLPIDGNAGIARTTLGEILSYFEEIKYTPTSQATYRTNAKDVNFSDEFVDVMRGYPLRHE